MFNLRKNQNPNNSAEAKLQALANVMAEEENIFPNDIKMPERTENSEEAGMQETLSDDGPISQVKADEIKRDEAIVRTVFELLGQDYDALIRMDPVVDEQNGTTTYSPYAKAIQANPGLVQEILAAESPVLAAVQIAMNFAPYAEFMAQYGEDPQSIKENMRKELSREMNEKMNKTTAPAHAAVDDAPVVTPFSRTSRKANKKIAFKEKSLKEIFGK